MINETPRTYSEPKQVDTWWVIEEVDADTGEITAEFGYATEAMARETYAKLTTPKEAA